MVAFSVHALLISDIISALLISLRRSSRARTLGRAHDQSHAGTGRRTVVATTEQGAGYGAKRSAYSCSRNDIAGSGFIDIDAQSLLRVSAASLIFRGELLKGLAGSRHDDDVRTLGHSGAAGQ